MGKDGGRVGGDRASIFLLPLVLVCLGGSDVDGAFVHSSSKITLRLRMTLLVKERKKSLTRGHVNDIGSAEGIQSYRVTLLVTIL